MSIYHTVKPALKCGYVSVFVLIRAENGLNNHFFLLFTQTAQLSVVGSTLSKSYRKEQKIYALKVQISSIDLYSTPI